MTTLGVRARASDRILVDGRPLPDAALHVYVLLHKPVGVLTTLRDPEGRPSVADLLPRGLPRLFPVGRLDTQSSGLVLLTNDGELAARLMHPRHHVPRIYRVKVGGTPDARALERLRRGVRLDGGDVAAAEATIEERLPTKSWLRVTVHEGRRHVVRRLCAAVGHRVEKLQRVALGPLRLGTLAPGRLRTLRSSELSALFQAVDLGRGRRAPHGARRRHS